MKRSLISAHRLEIILLFAAAGIPTVLLLVHSYLNGQSSSSQLGIELGAILVMVLTSALLYSHFSLHRLVRHLVREMLRPSAEARSERPGEKNAFQDHGPLASEIQRLGASLEQRDRLASELERLTEAIKQKDSLANEVHRLTGVLGQRDEQLREIREKVHEGVLQSRHHAESLREANQRLQALVTEAPVGIKIVDLEGKILLSNPASERIFGWTEDEVAGKPIWEIFGKLPGNVIGMLRAAAAGQPLHGQEIRVARKDSAALSISLSTSNLHDAENRVTGCMLVLSDVTKRKAADEALRLSEERYRALFSTIREGFALHEIICDENGRPCDYRFLEANPAFEEITGLKQAEIIGKRVLEVLPELEPSWIGVYGQVALTGEPVRFESYLKATDKHFEVIAFSPTKGQFATLFIDISQRKRTEGELVRLRKAVENSGEAMFLTDPGGTITWINPAFSRVYGYTPGEVVGRGTPRILKSGALKPEEYQRLWERLLDREVVTGEMVNKTKDGRLVTIEYSVNPVLDERNRILGFLAIQRDVSDRKRTEAALLESEEVYRTLVETSPDAIVLTALDGTIRLCNQRALAMAGCSGASELVGFNAFELMPEEERDRAREKAQALLTSDGISNREHTLIRKDGSRFPGDLNVSLYLDSHGQPKGLVAIIRDLTSRRRLEAQLLQAQKMEAIGKLAGGVAHDFNNLLTAIIGYSDLLLSDSAVTHSMRQDLQAIKKVGEKASGLVRQLLAFSRRQVMQPRIMNLNTAIRDMGKMLQRLVGENTEVVTVLDPDLGYTRADPVQIEQVLLNLAVNSRDAMPSGGKLFIETANVDLKESPPAAGLAVLPGKYIMLTLRDTGSGMDQETIAHAFEPFFSTKDAGRGSGLGLSTVYGIVSQSGGTISVESETGQGTTFRMYLPRVEKDPESRESGQAPKKSPQGNETILVAEDEDGVRGVVRSFLEGKGYKVLEARDGVEAMEIWEKHQGLIHLLVTDLVMPRMGGLELAQRLTRANEGLKVLYMSGYSDQAVANQGVLEPGTMFLQKPFSTDVLAQYVRRLLDGPAKS